MADIMGGFGVDSSIPLRAGTGAGAQANPLASVGDFARTLAAINATKLQGQQLQSGQMSLAQQTKQLTLSHIAAGVADGTIKDEASLTTALGSLEHNFGIPTNGVLADIVTQLGQGGTFADRLKGIVAAGTQAPENAVRAIAPIQSTLTEGLVNQPMLTGAPGTAGQGIRTPAGAPAQLGASPETQGQPVSWKDPSGAEHYGTFAQYNQALGNGQVNGPAVPTPRASPPPTVPSFGNPGGRYTDTPTQPGNPALRNAPAGAPAANAPASGSRVMTGPDGKMWTVPADKIAAATAAGYR